jgi:hypothetical protein
MAPSTFILASAPYAKDDVPLAGLVPDKRYPHQDVLSVIQVEEGKDYSVRIDKALNEYIHAESKSFFKTMITRLLSASVDIQMNSSFQVSSAEGRVYELLQPKTLFKQLSAREEVQRWLEDGYTDGQDIYFITGYRTLLNGKLVHKEGHTSNFSVGCQFPAGLAGGVDPTPEGEMDVGMAAELRRTAGGDGNLETQGERIYAICYRKVAFKFFKGADKVFLKTGNRWKPFFKTRSTDPAMDEVIEVVIEDKDEGLDGDSGKFATGDDEVIFVCLSSEEEEDASEEEEDASEEEEEEEASGGEEDASEEERDD